MAHINRAIQLYNYLSSELRIRLVLLLNCYEELTLKQICNKLGKTKVTITNHLKGLKEIDILHVREENIRGPLVRKFYSVDPRSFSETIVKCKDVDNLKSGDKWKYMMEKTNYHRFQYVFLRDLLNQIIPYMEDIRNHLIQKSSLGEAYSDKISQLNLGENFFFPLNEDEYNIYMEETYAMLEKVSERFANLHTKKDYKREKPFLAWHVVFPIRKIFESKPIS